MFPSDSDRNDTSIFSKSFPASAARCSSIGFTDTTLSFRSAGRTKLRHSRMMDSTFAISLSMWEREVTIFGSPWQRILRRPQCTPMLVMGFRISWASPAAIWPRSRRRASRSLFSSAISTCVRSLKNAQIPVRRSSSFSSASVKPIIRRIPSLPGRIASIREGRYWRFSDSSSVRKKGLSPATAPRFPPTCRELWFRIFLAISFWYRTVPAMSIARTPARKLFRMSVSSFIDTLRPRTLDPADLVMTI